MIFLGRQLYIILNIAIGVMLSAYSLNAMKREGEPLEKREEKRPCLDEIKIQWAKATKDEYLVIPMYLAQYSEYLQGLIRSVDTNKRLPTKLDIDECYQVP